MLLLGRIRTETWGIGGMAFGGVLAARAAAWLIVALRQPVPRAWPVAIMVAVFLIGALVAMWGARLYHRVRNTD